MHHDVAHRACRVTLEDGTVHERVSLYHVDEFDDWWATSEPTVTTSLPIGNVRTVEPSMFALSADLATKTMHGEEWRMGAYRYAVELRSGERFSLIDARAVWLPDSMTADDVVDAWANPEEDYPSGGQIPRVERCVFSMPQTREAERAEYEAHFRAVQHRQPDPNFRSALDASRSYASEFALSERPLAYAAMKDWLTSKTSRYERFMGDDIELLARFADREGHCNIPPDHVELGRRLSVVGLMMSLRLGTLSDADTARLEQIPGWHEAAEAAVDSFWNPELTFGMIDRARELGSKRSQREDLDQE